MTLTFVFKGAKQPAFINDELFQIYKNFTKLRMLQATDAFRDALHPRRGRQRGSGNVVPVPSAFLALPELGISGGTGSLI